MTLGLLAASVFEGSPAYKVGIRLSAGLRPKTGASAFGPTSERRRHRRGDGR